MEKRTFYNQIWSLAIFLVLSTVVLGLSLVIVVSMNDYVYYQFYETASDMVTSGLLPSSILTNIEDITDYALTILPAMDKIWAVAFLIFFIDFMVNAYKAKREGFFSIFGFLTFGVMISLFALSLIVTFNSSIYNIFFTTLLENLTVDFTFFNLYISYFQQVNLIMIVSGLLINYIPLDLTLFKNRKSGDEIEEVV